MAEHLCLTCESILGSRLRSAFPDRQPHLSDMVSLVQSAENCAMCRVFLDSLSEAKREAIMNLVAAGSYSTLIVCTGQPTGEDRQVEQRVGRNSLFHLEVSTKERCFYSNTLLLLPLESELNARAIWNSDKPVPFSDRVPVILEWIEECSLDHPRCAIDTTSYLPTRIIAVGHKGTTDVRLLSSADASEELLSFTPKYAALSHCWGAKKPSAMLTHEVLPQWLQSIHVKSLPKTFRDAIYLTRALDIPYLWIDCMCILQDDVADWEREAASMADIYRNAHLTIAAASSEDSTGGCFIENHMSPLVRKFALHSADGERREVVVRPSLVQVPELSRSPLHTRGWILQEQILSRRTIYLTDGQIFWQCHTRQKSEDGLRDGHIFCLKTASLAQYEFDKLRRSDDTSPDRSWWLWIHEYSSRKFTVFSDRLAALAGVTRLYQEATGDKPLLGLWERHLLQNLLWTRKPDPTGTSRTFTNKDSDSGLPSWSWIDIDGLILPPSGLILSAEQRRHTPGPPKMYTTLLASRIEWSGVPLSSRLLSASITLTGPLMEMGDYLELEPAKGRLECELDDHYSPLGLPEKLNDCASSSSSSLEGKETTDVSHKCPLTRKHGESRISLDYDALLITMKVFGLLIDLDAGQHRTTDSRERILLLAAVDSTHTKFRRLGVAEHEHAWSRMLQLERGCALHGQSCTSECSEGCIGVLSHKVVGCFEGAPEQTLELI